MNEVLIVLGTSLATGFAGWIFGGKQVAKNNSDRSEIENLKLITQEWREAAQSWKDMADEYQKKHIDNSRKLTDMADEIQALKRQVARQTKRIAELEKHEKR